MTRFYDWVEEYFLPGLIGFLVLGGAFLMGVTLWFCGQTIISAISGILAK